eukprot:1250630-Pyramimonas_sp.AAC.1
MSRTTNSSVAQVRLCQANLCDVSPLFLPGATCPDGIARGVTRRPEVIRPFALRDSGAGRRAGRLHRILRLRMLAE